MLELFKYVFYFTCGFGVVSFLICLHIATFSSGLECDDS